MKLDPRIDAHLRQKLRDGLRSEGRDPYDDTEFGIRPEDFLLGGAEFRQWDFEQEVAMFSRVGLNEGVIDEPLGVGIPEEQPPDIEAQCLARAEILFLRLMLPQRCYERSLPLMVQATFGSFVVSGKRVKANGEQIRRILWLRVLMQDGAIKLSERCQNELTAMQERFRPGHPLDWCNPRSFLEWHSWIGSQQAMRW